MAQSPARWSAEEFQRLRERGDPEIDDAVAAYLRDHRRSGDARGQMAAVIRSLAAAKRAARAGRGDVPEILESLELRSPLPGWATDTDLLERGRRVFTDHGLAQSIVLSCVCLPLAYADPASAKVLAAVSDLATGNLTRRVAETGQMLIDVMCRPGPAGLRPGGPGHTTAVSLRVLHSFVRALVREQGVGDEVAVNQELLLATLIDFSCVAWEALDRLGVSTTDEDRRAYLYVWSVVGHLMGIEACRDAPLTLADVEPVERHLESLLESSVEGRRLMAALLADLESYMYLGWRKLPRTLMHWIFQGWDGQRARVPELLGVPGPAWWGRPLLAAAGLARRLPLVHWLLRKAGRFVVIGFVERYSDGPAPFEIPRELARSWRIRRSSIARWVRRSRRAIRRAVRSALPHRHISKEE